ncbi:oxidoreductase [Halieaceae bacterium IMCC14734]|uniref:Oxidoreductase n=1 Tax=Candidatus Litorirhabdus singularis TaxID=2518993 RepID=A0ABT3TKC2_9GAMM|nr:medium chain dehydrogenase/reductase family protein [Candidatus Litorirhabdus singularis]MCX2982747.1 oxidoreductase [Candidatus Litorirhabdus singularis]
MRVYLLLLALIWTLPASSAGYQQVVITEFGSADKLQLRQVPKLPEPGAGEIRVKVLTASASFTDIMVRKGLYAGVSEEPPFAPGYDLVGVIDKLGAGVGQLTVGQRVADLTVIGAYSEYVILPAANVVPLPPEINDEEAVALILSYTTAYQMLYRSARVEAGQTILIHGASGAVGTALAQLGRVSGLKMYGTASASKHDYVRSLGVIPIDYRAEDFVARVQQETGMNGVDAAFDAISVDNFQRSYETLAPGGRLVTYGFYLASRDGDSMLTTAAEFLHWRWQQLLWQWFPEDQKSVEFYSITDVRKQHPDWFKDDLGSLFEMLIEGNIKPEIWAVKPLSEAASAHRDIESGAVRGKIVLRVATPQESSEVQL